MRSFKPDRFLSQSRYEFVFDALGELAPKLPSPVVFDIGCGNGGMKRIEDRGLQWRGFDRTAWRLAAEWDLSDPCPVDEKAGAILLMDVIGCCPNPGLALRNVGAAMLPGARLIFTDPNPLWSASRTFHLFSGYVASYRPQDVSEIEHYFPLWPHVMEKLLADAGLVIEEHVSLEGPSPILRQRPDALYPLRVVNGLARAAIELADPRAIGMSYALIARKL